MSAATAAFADHFQRFAPLIEAALKAVCAPRSGCPAKLTEAIAYCLLAPGKRLRPMLALLAAEACGGSPTAALPAATAVEMVHAYSLVHDDLPAMDDDDLRRGRPTCHKVFGEATAILAGDALLAMAFETLALCVRPAETAARCCAVLAEAAGPCQLVGGQADDIAASGLKLADLGKDALDLLHAIHRRKTGAMICAALQLGAMTAAAPPVQLAALAEYGASLGLAFQIADDLLDARGDEAAMGKRVGKDAASGKLTFPGLVGVDESTRRAQQLIGQARAALAPLAGPTDGLEALARYVLERNR